MTPNVQCSVDLRCDLPIRRRYAADYLTYHGVLPLRRDGDFLDVAAAGDVDDGVLCEFAREFHADVRVTQVSRESLEEAVRDLFEQTASIGDLFDTPAFGSNESASTDSTVTDTRDLINQPPVVQYVNLLLRDAHIDRASDIHIEATRTGLRVRRRIDGVLSTYTSPPFSIQQAVVSRVKLIAELDIAQTRVPQDGRIRLRGTNDEHDVRVASVPTQFGESLVLRLLSNESHLHTLADLAIPINVRNQFEVLVRQPQGLVLATGPTGSGKTTTLHAALALRASDREKLISVEDPIEYSVDGVTQVPVTAAAHITFATVLRSILRQDPDVVLVGEMRDEETASIAVQAALTGHLVLSTLHTNDAVSAVTRLLDLGVRPFLLAATLRGVLAQRLVRRLCDRCKEKAGKSFQATGCAQCRGSGYRGRVGLYELFVVSEEIRNLIARGEDTTTLGAAARRQGMPLLRDAAVEAIRAGETSEDEIVRVLGAVE